MNRSKILTTFFLLIFSISLRGQKPEPIYSFVKVMKPISWYKEQSLAWQKEIKKNKKNALAWYYYYRVNRNLAYQDTTDTRSHEEKWKSLSKLVDEMGKVVPNSYEYNLCKWMSGGNNYENLPYLKKTEALGQGRLEHMPDMIIWGEIERNEDRKMKYAKIWYESGDMSPALMNYNYNVMAGTKPNAIVITHGDNDTYPMWLLQSQGIRKDIAVLNLSLLNIEEYRNKVFKELGIDPWEMVSKSDSSHLSESEKWQQASERFEKGIIKHIAANKNKRPVYVVVTTGEPFTQHIEDKLYLTGLTYLYSDSKVDNIAMIKRNFEQNYAIDYLDRYFVIDKSQYWVSCMHQNYCVPLAKLYEHYKECNETDKAQRCKNLILKIVKESEQEKEWNEYFQQN